MLMAVTIIADRADIDVLRVSAGAREALGDDEFDLAYRRGAERPRREVLSELDAEAPPVTGDGGSPGWASKGRELGAMENVVPLFRRDGHDGGHHVHAAADQVEGFNRLFGARVGPSCLVEANAIGRYLGVALPRDHRIVRCSRLDRKSVV